MLAMNYIIFLGSQISQLGFKNVELEGGLGLLEAGLLEAELEGSSWKGWV